MSRHWIVVAGAPFFPAQDGGEREHLGFIESLLAEGWLAGLVVPTDEDPASLGREDDMDALRELIAPAPLFMTPRLRLAAAAPRATRRPYVIASRPVPRNLPARVAMQAPEADGVVVFAFKSADIGKALATELGLPAVLRHHNLEGPYHQALAGSMAPPKSWAVNLEAARIDREERRLEAADWITGIADISATDAEIRRARSSVPVAHVPTFALGPKPAEERPVWERPASPVVVFVGALHVGTNHDAIEWFAAEVWPRVREQHPDARWQIVGRTPTERVHALVARTPGTELHPDVPDPRTYLCQASVAINPTVSGSGVNIKLVEYLSVGIPVVSTTKGAAGLGLTPGKDLFVADTAGEFAGAVAQALAAPDPARSVGRQGLTTADRILDVRGSLRTMAELMDGVPPAR
ncbi:MAG TPA: glycosyltransferase [Arachnia sp.]|nr:glycosyltransferase [Arachnia sp.]HMT85209.1 glycosyltransferase [Arachnia sp.]